MSDRSFNIAMVFRADTAEARAAVKEFGQEFSLAGGKTAQSTAALTSHAAALDKDAAASRKAASEALKLSDAEKRAYEQAKRHADVPLSRPGPRGGPVSPQTPANTPGEKVVPFGPEYPRAIEDARAKYVPLFAAQRTFQAEQKEINAAHKRGALSAVEHAAAMKRLQHSYDTQVERVKRLDPALVGTRRNMKLNAHEAQNLSYQINDVTQSALLGMPPLQILMQQGPQITQIYGGVGNTFRRLTALLTVSRIAMGAVTGAVVVGAGAWNGYLTSTKAVATASEGIGRSVAGTLAQMEFAARAGAAAAGIGVKSAREMQVQFLQTGKIGSENFEELIGLSRDFGATLGIEAKEVGGALADMFSDPAQAADDLLNKYGLIDAATARQARTLAAQNRQSEAQAVLIDALPDRLANATEAVTGLAGAWNTVKTGASNALDTMGAAIDRVLDPEGFNIDDRIAGQQSVIDRLRGSRRNPARVKKELEAARAVMAFLVKERGRIFDEAAGKFEDQNKAAEERLGAVAIGIANQSPAVKDQLKREELENRIAALRQGQNAPGLDDTQRSRINTAIEAAQNALGGLIGKQHRLNELAVIEVQIQNERNPLIRAELEARRLRLQMADQEITFEKSNAEAARVRLRVMAETMGAARAQASDMQAEAEVRARLNALVAAGSLTVEQANSQLQEELRLRPLLAAAAAAQGKELAELQQTIDAVRDGYAALEKQRVQASANAVLRSQEQTLDELRTEVSLLGASAEVRAKVLALMEAEQKIRELGIDGTSQAAAGIKKNAEVTAELTLVVDRLSDAWGKVDSAAESAIDGVVDKLAGGDIAGALEALSKEITGMFIDIGIKNPLKNAILGTNYGTLDDVGGLQGILGRLTGQNEVTSPKISSQALSAGSMVVNAGSVTVTGGLGFAPGAGGGLATNINGVAPAGGLTGKSGVQKQVWDFFAAKGLKPHQISGILGNVSAESGFNPLAVGDNGHAFGLFQHNDRRHKLFKHIGGKGNLGDVQAQLDFVWKELQTSENASYKRLLNSNNVREATSAFVGFERPRGYSVANPENSMHFDRRLGAANEAMTRFSQTTAVATQDLGKLGKGFDLVGNVLGQVGQGSGGSTGGGIGVLISGLAGAIGIPGFKLGGPTGGSDPSRVAGVVHEQEFVFDAAATRRIGARNLEALRKGRMPGYRKGGYVSAAALPAVNRNSDPASSTGSVVMINNYTGQPAKEEETVGPGGKRQTVITIGEQGAAAIAQSGNPMDRQIRQTYRLKRAGPSR